VSTIELHSVLFLCVHGNNDDLLYLYFIIAVLLDLVYLNFTCLGKLELYLFGMLCESALLLLARILVENILITAYSFSGKYLFTFICL
jgi:hypothetical protein